MLASQYCRVSCGVSQDSYTRFCNTAYALAAEYWVLGIASASWIGVVATHLLLPSPECQSTAMTQVNPEHARLLLEWNTVVSSIGAMLWILRHRRDALTRAKPLRDTSPAAAAMKALQSLHSLVNRTVSTAGLFVLSHILLLNTLLYWLPGQVCLSYDVVAATASLGTATAGHVMVSLQTLPQMHRQAGDGENGRLHTVVASPFATSVYLQPVVQLSFLAVAAPMFGPWGARAVIVMSAVLLIISSAAWAALHMEFLPSHVAAQGVEFHGNCATAWVRCASRSAQYVLCGARSRHTSPVLPKPQRKIFRRHKAAFSPAMQLNGLVGAPLFLITAAQCAYCSVSVDPTYGLERSSLRTSCTIPIIDTPPQHPVSAKLLTGLLTVCFIVLLISSFAWEQALFEMSTAFQTSQQAQTTAMLRWLSHECRSPVAAAIMSIDSIMEDLLPSMQDMIRGCMAESHVPTGAAHSELSDADVRRKMRSTASAMQEMVDDMRSSVGMVSQPIKGLADVRDNMLLYMRRQRGGHSATDTPQPARARCCTFCKHGRLRYRMPVLLTMLRQKTGVCAFH